MSAAVSWSRRSFSLLRWPASSSKRAAYLLGHGGGFERAQVAVERGGRVADLRGGGGKFGFEAGAVVVVLCAGRGECFPEVVEVVVGVDERVDDGGLEAVDGLALEAVLVAWTSATMSRRAGPNRLRLGTSRRPGRREGRVDERGSPSAGSTMTIVTNSNAGDDALRLTDRRHGMAGTGCAR